jgi:Mg/Co/Ni transporter MgtE
MDLQNAYNVRQQPQSTPIWYWIRRALLLPFGWLRSSGDRHRDDDFGPRRSPLLKPHTSVANESVLALVWSRLSVLVSLLLLQSLSQFVLQSFEGLIQNNIAIPLFLTMLVGAGGNAGNQATVRSVTGLATGEFRANSIWAVFRREVCVGLVCAACLACIGFLRVHYFFSQDDDNHSPPDLIMPTIIAISLSLFCIVLGSVIIGSVLPFYLLRLGINPEHAAPTIQVVMDILGVFITCMVCSTVLPSAAPPPSPMVGPGPTPQPGGVIDR